MHNPVSSEAIRTDGEVDHFSPKYGVSTGNVQEESLQIHSATRDKVVREGSKMEQDISASQKMLSAVSGSLLTSLLGECAPSRCTIFDRKLILAQ